MILTNLLARRLGRYPNLCLAAGVAMTLAAALAGGPGHDSHGGAAAGPRGDDDAAGVVTPASALERLGAGNERFSSGQPQHPNCDAARRNDCAKNGQHPFATILTCSDSRLAAERIFDQGIGDLFVVRVAGNVADTDEIGTIEYGVGHLHTPLLVVMGHTKCGAVKAACAGGELEGFLPQLVDNIMPAVANARHQNPQLSSEQLVDPAVEANVMQSLADILRRSAEVRELIEHGKLVAVGAVYDLDTGRARWLGLHPDQDRVLTQFNPEHAGGGMASGSGHGAPTSESRAAHGAAPASGATIVAGMTMERSDHHGGVSANLSKSGHGGHAATPAGAGHPSGPPLPKPGDALQQLRDGNARFVGGRASNPRGDMGWVSQTADGQHPFVTVLTCSDSRLPVERVFDQGIGDLFVVRVAGNVADVDEIASIEYATAHLHTPLLLVLGHTQCGAVKAVAGKADVHGCIPELVDNITPAVALAQAWGVGLTGDALISAAVRTNVRQSMQDVMTRSCVVRGLVASGKVMVVGGVYDIADGTIEWLDDPTRPAAMNHTASAVPTPAGGAADAPSPQAEPAHSAHQPH